MPTDEEADLDRLITLYDPEGHSTLVTPRDLIERGMTHEQVLEAEQYGIARYKPVADALESVRRPACQRRRSSK